MRHKRQDKELRMKTKELRGLRSEQPRRSTPALDDSRGRFRAESQTQVPVNRPSAEVALILAPMVHALVRYCWRTPPAARKLLKVRAGCARKQALSGGSPTVSSSAARRELRDGLERCGIQQANADCQPSEIAAFHRNRRFQTL